MIRWLGSWFGIKFVELKDFDGDLTIRRIRWDLDGDPYVERMGFWVSPQRLLDGGDCEQYLEGYQGYVKIWRYYTPPNPIRGLIKFYNGPITRLGNNIYRYMTRQKHIPVE